MTDKRRGLGRGLGALIPNGTAPVTKPAGDRPVDVFFPGRGDGTEPEAGAGGTATLVEERSDSLEELLERSLATVAPRSTPEQDDVRPGPAEGTGDLVPVPGLRFAELPVGQVRPNPRQPRQVFDEEALAELVHSVREIGVLQPVVVRPAGTDEAGQPRYELVMGERRWRAVQEAGLATIPAIVRETADDDLLRDALLENLHRAELNPLEEAAAYQQLLDDFGCTHEELAGRIGRSRPQISNTLRLLKLPPAVQRRVAAGVLSAGHARALLGLDDAGHQEDLATRIVAEGMSVRATEEAVLLTRGEKPPIPRPRRPRPADSPTTHDLAERLSHTFDTRVRVEMGQRKGRIVVEFGSVDDLERIAGLMGGTG